MPIIGDILTENIHPRYVDIARKTWNTIGMTDGNICYFDNRTRVKQIVSTFVNHIQTMCNHLIGSSELLTEERVGEHLPFLLGKDVTTFILSELASLNDLIKVRGKALPKFKRMFYELKQNIISYLFSHHRCLKDVWKEYKVDTGEEFYVFAFECGGLDYVFHQPERNFREERQHYNSRLRHLPEKTFHISPQTTVTEADEEFTMADLEARYSRLWLNAQYLLNHSCTKYEKINLRRS